MRTDIYRFIEKMMAMDEAAWARHANPASVWSRFTVLPLITLAIWSRIWLGWYCVIPLALCLVWTWWNPRAFPPPHSTDNWASRGTFGERVYLNRRQRPIPRHHEIWANVLTAVSAIGLMPWIWGLWAQDPSATLLGLALIVGGKTWFVDRMVWLYQDMIDADPSYRTWLR